MYEHLLVATDGSPHGTKAVEAAADLADKLGAAVSLVTVAGQGDVPENMVQMLRVEHLIDETSEPDVSADALTRIPTPAVRADLRAEQAAKVHALLAKYILDDAVTILKKAGANLVDARLENGKPADVILAIAEQTGANLIVIGSRGFGDVKSLIMGSVSHRILQLAECPCLVVK